MAIYEDSSIKIKKDPDDVFSHVCFDFSSSRIVFLLAMWNTWERQAKVKEFPTILSFPILSFFVVSVIDVIVDVLRSQLQAGFFTI